MSSKTFFSLPRFLSALLVLLIFFGLFTLGACNKTPDEPSSSQPAQTTTEISTAVPTTQAPQLPLNPLTGMPGIRPEIVGKRPIAVVVENSPQARPQWGFCSPDIVIEGVVEGGITRMLWLYSDVEDIPKVGPMRSARHDFVEMAEGLDAIFAHWGWSDIAERAIKDRKVNNINGLEGKYFYRDKSRKTAIEHTGYSDGQSLARAIKDKNYDRPIKDQYTKPFSFASLDSLNTPKGGNSGGVHIEFSSYYKHDFKFKKSDGLYYNYMNGNPMLEDGGKQMSVTNVIIIYCSTKVVDATGHVDMDLSSGEGVFLSNGAYENITWKKGNDPNDMLKLYDSQGGELKLNPGKSYIGFVPKDQAPKTSVIEAGE
ncbi:MAG TPA: DUF3048 domain-containing protein [Clostridiales bacterium]|nr:DUF3048 domain-containing protein [Clostridiales bacterium]